MTEAGRLTPKNIAGIQPGESNWKCKVLVLGKTNPHTTKGGKTRLQKCLLHDEMGDSVELVLWNEKIESYVNNLMPFKTYSVRGAWVRKVKEEYQHLSPGIQNEWTATAKTVAVLITDPSQQIPYPPYSSTDLNAAEEQTAERQPIDILAVAIEIENRRNTSTKYGDSRLQQLRIIDRSLVPTIFTLWDEHLNNQGADLYNRRHSLPIIMCRRAIPSDFAAGALQANALSYVVVEPNIAEATALRQWAKENIDAIRQSEQQERPKRKTIDSETESTLNQNATGRIELDDKRFIIRGKMSVADTYQRITYCVCKECNQILASEMDEKVYCDRCGGDRKLLPRYQITVQIQNETEDIEATLFDKKAEQLLRQSPEKMHRTKLEEIHNLLLEANTALESQIITAELRTGLKTIPNRKPRYTVHEWNQTNLPVDAPETPNLQISQTTTETDLPVTDVSDIHSTAATTNETEVSLPNKMQSQEAQSSQTSGTSHASDLTLENPGLSQDNTTPKRQMTIPTPEKRESKRLKPTGEQPTNIMTGTASETQMEPSDPKKLREIKIEEGSKK